MGEQDHSRQREESAHAVEVAEVEIVIHAAHPRRPPLETRRLTPGPTAL